MIILKDYESAVHYIKQQLDNSTITSRELSKKIDSSEGTVYNVLSNSSQHKAMPTLQAVANELGYTLKRVRSEHYELRRIEDDN